MDQRIEACGAAATRETSLGALPVPVTAATESPRVLVVDDNSVNQTLAVLLLRKLGVQADTAFDGFEALKAIERIPYCLVLMDCHMPGMDGLAATRELRRLECGRSRLPVIAMTASAGDDLKGCVEAGMDGSLPKPAKRADMDQLLRSWAAAVSPDAVKRLSLTVDGDAEVLAALIGEFVGYGAPLAAVLPAASARGDRGALSSAAHSLRGACANFGARHLAYLCSRLEAMAEAGQAPACGAFAEAAVAEFERVREALETIQSASSNL